MIKLAECTVWCEKKIIQNQISPVYSLLYVDKGHVTFVAPLRPLQPKNSAAESVPRQHRTLKAVEPVVTHARRAQLVYLVCVKLNVILV